MSKKLTINPATPITLEQARVFEAVARLGTAQLAARELHKVHSAVIYAVKNLEAQTGLELLDRSGYRNRLTPAGQTVLKYCQQLLSTCRELDQVCRQMQDGWEPHLQIIYDGVVDFDPIAETLRRWGRLGASTQLQVLAAHLDEVEDLFHDQDADMMLTVMPLRKGGHPLIRLPPLRMHLVASHQHALFKGRRKCTADELVRVPLIQIQSSSVGLGLPTDTLRFQSHFFVNDFGAKKTAVQKGLGMGWLPEYLIVRELTRGTLQTVHSEISAEYTLHPQLYHRPGKRLGRAGKHLLQLFTAR